MNFSFDLQWAAMTWSVSPDAMMWISTIFWAIFGWLAMMFMIIYLAIIVLMVISRWKAFTKAWLPGWGIFVPFYNIVLMLQLWGFSGRRLLSILFPPLFVVILIINYFNIAQKFWKHWTYGFGILFLPFIFIPILAFDKSTYMGKKTIVKSFPEKAMVKSAVKKAPAKKVIKKAPAKKVIKKVKTLIKKK